MIARLGKNARTSAGCGAAAACLIAVCLVSMGLVAAASPARASEGTGLRTAIAVDLVGNFGSSATENTSRFEAREVEALFFAPIDHLFEGAMSLAAHQESGKAFFEIHEAHIGSTRLVPRSRFRLGQFFPAVGRMQQFHRHDWPFTSAPRFYRNFFGEEGFIDTGLEFSFLVPSSLFLDITGGATSGWVFGHSHNLGEKPIVPTHYLRLATYAGFSGADGIAIGANYVGRTSGAGETKRHLGLDATAKWREGRTLEWLVQSETWLRSMTPSGGTVENELGTYLYAQKALGPETQLGIRLDYSSLLTLKSATGQKLSNGALAAVPTLSWRPSEFSTLRLSYAQEYVFQSGSAASSSGLLQLQTTFILGAHPAHDF